MARFFALIFPLLLLLAVSAQAAERYTIENVTVSAGGQDGSAARAEAIAKGEREAYLALLKRLAPQISDEQEQAPAGDVSALISAYDIKNEKVPPNHDEAVADFSFNPSVMRQHLKELGVNYQEGKH